MERVTRRSFVATVGAASVLPATALLTPGEAAETVKPDVAGIATPDISAADPSSNRPASG
jgi:hypothetical protein